MPQNKQIKRLSSGSSPFLPISILVAFFHVGEQWLKWLYWSSLMGSQMKPVWAWEINWFVLKGCVAPWCPLLFALCKLAVSKKGGSGGVVCVGQAKQSTQGWQGRGQEKKKWGKEEKGTGWVIPLALSEHLHFIFSRWEFSTCKMNTLRLIYSQWKEGSKDIHMHGPTTPPCGHPAKKHLCLLL